MANSENKTGFYIKQKNSQALHEGQCIILLPQRGNTGEDATSTEESWSLKLPDGIDFDGQHFTVESDIETAAEARWLEPSLLSVKISIKSEVSAPCARCLKQTKLTIADDLMYLYFLQERESGSGSKAGAETEQESGLDNFDDGFMPVEVDYFGRTLDLTPQVWESLLLLLPSKVLCREDCAGLCPNCGADLNEGPCGCTHDEGDPRFAVLKNIVLDSPES